MNLLVAGGAGFIGSNFIRYMLDRDQVVRVVNLDALTYAGNLDNLIEIEQHPRYTFVQGDIRHGETVSAVLEKYSISVIVNFAAETHVDRSIQDSRIFVETNVLGTQVLLEAAKIYGIDRFVQVSTDEVYGSLGPEGLFREDSPLVPSSPYSASKAGADLLSLSYHRTFGIPVSITRCSNNFGPRQFPEKLIPLMILKAVNNEPLPVYGDGQNIRDWLYVEDHCEAIDLVIRKGRAGEVYNIGGRQELTNLQVVRRILHELGKPEFLIHFVPDRLGHDRRYGIDAGKIGRELGWQPRHDWDISIPHTVRWYLSHPEWVSRIRSGAYRTKIQKQSGLEAQQDASLRPQDEGSGSD